MNTGTSCEFSEDNEFFVESFILEHLSMPSTSISKNDNASIETVNREVGGVCDSLNASVVAPFDSRKSNVFCQDFSWNLSPISHYEPSLRSNLSNQRLIGLRTMETEEKLGIFQFAIWRISLNDSENVLCNLTNEITGKSYKVEDFKVISELDLRRRGVLMRVSSLELKHLIFAHRRQFRSRGYELDLF